MKFVKLSVALLALAAVAMAADQAGKPSAAAALPTTVSLDLGKDVTMKLQLIKPGKFLMGSNAQDEQRDADETPHNVEFKTPFYMAVTEVTQEQYEAVTGRKAGDGRSPKNPAEPVSYNEAVEFCKKLSEKVKRTVKLPTEAQWEYAARAGGAGRYCFGDDAALLGDYAWYAGNRAGKVQPVGQKKPNAWGLYDMYGNAMEWVSDFYDTLPAAAATQPTGPDKGDSRILRGGGWTSDARQCRSAYRIRVAPDSKGPLTGFRVIIED